MVAVLELCYYILIASKPVGYITGPRGEVMYLQHLQVRENRHVLQHNIGGRSEEQMFG